MMMIKTIFLICLVVILNTLLVLYLPRSEQSGEKVTSALQSCPESPSSITRTKNPTETGREATLVVYVFSEANKESSGIQRIENLKFFIKHGYCSTCTNVDFAFIHNGPVTFAEFPKGPNVQVYQHDRVCKGADIGAWDFLLNMKDRKKYKKYMFINDTVRGPFIDPLVAALVGPDFHFTDLFARLINNQTKLVGSYINCGTVAGPLGPDQGFSHVQSFAWMIDDVALDLVRSTIQCYSNKVKAIEDCEIGMSRKILEEFRYNIGSMLFVYRGIDFRTEREFKLNCNNRIDPTYNNFYGEAINPLEVVFYKNSRKGVEQHLFLDSYTTQLNRLQEIKYKYN